MNSVWFDSTQATIFKDRGAPDPAEVFPKMVRKVIFELFDGRIHDREHAISIYLAHNARVREVIPADRLLVYELAQGWAPLCMRLPGCPCTGHPNA